MSNTTEIKCKNCGAPYTALQIFTSLKCEYCGTVFFWEDRNPFKSTSICLSGVVTNSPYTSSYMTSTQSLSARHE